MKIIHRGERPEDQVYRAGCWRCATQVEFQRSEATYHSDQRDGDYLAVTCPVCGSAITASVRR